ncbi:MAG TPA: hypothetical protein VGU44_03955 [Gammaproteobacteria bacterium]|nr:hypothetical protein [Gammaproteobacteria bacterium]
MTEIEIRKALDRITSEELPFDDWETALRDQSGRIEKIIGTKALSSPVGLESEFQKNVNCHAYALGLWELEEFRALANTRQGFLVKGSIIQELINATMIMPIEAPVENCLILYLKGNSEITHSGLLRENNEVESKWRNLPVFRHIIGHVPESYGEENRYYMSKGAEEIHEFLLFSCRLYKYIVQTTPRAIELAC